MIFEDELGIKPAHWLRNERVDAFLDDNCIHVLPWEELLVRQTGLHLSMIRLIVAAVATVPLGFLHRVVPTANGRHLYALATGAALLYYPFGNQIWLVVVSSVLIYLVMLAAPRRAGMLSWCIAFPYLLICMERTGDLWDSGAVDITGSLMVLVLKQVALCHNLSDSFTREGSRHYSTERHLFKVTSAPNPLHYLSYIFATGNLLAGPFFEYREYMDFMSRRGSFARACDWTLFGQAAAAAVRCFGVASAGVAMSQLIESKFSARMLLPPGVLQRSMPERIAIAFLTGFGKRCQYYFIWGLSEAGINAMGFGFNGFAGNKAKFDRYTNTEVVKVETCYSIAIVPKFWNVNTGVFLRRYVYDRVGKGLAGLAVTQIVSGLWHGLREGHLLFFLMTVPLFAGSKVFYKQEKRLPAAVYESVPWKCLKWFISHAQLNIFCQSFLLQKWRYCWQSIMAFRGVPHIFGIAVLALGSVLPTPKRYRQYQAEQAAKAPKNDLATATGRSKSVGVLPEGEDKKGR